MYEYSIKKNNLKHLKLLIHNRTKLKHFTDVIFTFKLISIYNIS
jgi:hypothetical protein